jgi:four helix bundle protein
MRVESYQRLIVWQRAMDLVCASYVVARALPLTERYGLASQLQRAAVSVPANIAEGHSRTHRKEFLQSLAVARGSLKELETHLLIAERVGYVDRLAIAHPLRLVDEVSRMLTAMRAALTRP